MFKNEKKVLKLYFTPNIIHILESKSGMHGNLKTISYQMLSFILYAKMNLI